MTASIKVHFENLSDPRIEAENKVHDLLDIVVLAILSTLNGAEGWQDIHLWMELKADWLKQFLRHGRSTSHWRRYYPPCVS